ncbi:MAG: hypothetical protein IAX21_02530 [Candidatus Bathyarchaeota archaeon]|nr:MAG: hypothetical protein NUK63_03045 [Candidatus Bathyarchaeum tardum]WNZ29755.1 MAG: hypothetical protein IAX21_02530 [Candidatus Bathyarchaeota archaeon]
MNNQVSNYDLTKKLLYIYYALKNMEIHLEKKRPFRVELMFLAVIFTILVMFTPFFLNRLLTPDRLPDIVTPLPTEIKSINWDENNHQIKVIVENTINDTVTLIEVYSNETLDSEAVIATRVLSQNQSTEIILSQKYITKPNRITVRITTSGEIDAYKSKIFYEIGLNQVDWDEKTGKIKVVVRNSGDETVTLSEVYADGARDVSALPDPIILESQQETTVSLTGTFMDTYTPIPIKVVTIEGISAEVSKSIYGLWIQSINWNSNEGKIVAYVYEDGYEGAGDGEVAYVYVNGTIDSSATIHDGDGVWNISLSATYVNKPQQITLKVVTTKGAFGEMTMSPPNEYFR